MSWQAIWVKSLLRFLVSLKPASLNLASLRSKFEIVSHFILVPAEIRSNPVVIDGISAEWVKTVYTPQDSVCLYLHGGGYALCSVSTHRDLIARIVKCSGIQVLGLNYRLAPENPHPAALEDAVSAYHWLLEQGFEPEKIIFAGDSAGGGLCLATLVRLRDTNCPLPAGVVCISPWTDLSVSHDILPAKTNRKQTHPKNIILELAKAYFGENDPTLPYISPVYADLKGLPPILIQVGADDILLDDSTRLAKRARENGVKVKLQVWEDMVHVFQAFAILTPEGKTAIAQIGLFIRHQLTN